MGLAVGHVGATGEQRRSWAWLILVIVAANAADLDFLPGLLVGDLNRYHHLAAHSLGAALLFGAGVGVVARRFSGAPLRIGALAALVYASHLLGDYVTVDERAPYGIPLFWPLSERFFISPITFLGAVKHGNPGDGHLAVLLDIFSTHNLRTIGLELLLLLPALAVILWTRRPRRV